MIKKKDLKKYKILNQYQNSIKKLEMYLKRDLKELEISCCIIYGSSVYEDVFVPGVSDIDVIAYTKKMDELSGKEIIKIIKKTSSNFKDKEPVIYLDHIGYRIEFYYDTLEIPFDITLLNLEIPNFDKRETDSSYDSLEMIIGSLYEKSVLLFGNQPLKKFVNKNFIPFYSDDLRKKRLAILTKRLVTYTDRVEMMLKNHNPDIIDHLYKTRNHFLKWLFIYKRKYPVNLSKHLNYQLNYLGLTKEEVKILQFLDSKNLYQMAEQYIELSKKYINEYKKEVRYEKK